MDDGKACKLVSAGFIRLDGARDLERLRRVPDHEEMAISGQYAAQRPREAPREQSEENHRHHVQGGVKAQEQAANVLGLRGEGQSEEQRGRDESDLQRVGKSAAQLLLPDLAIDARSHARADPDAQGHRHDPEVIDSRIERPGGAQVSANEVRKPEARQRQRGVGQQVEHADHAIVAREHWTGPRCRRSRQPFQS